MGACQPRNQAITYDPGRQRDQEGAEAPGKDQSKQTTLGINLNNCETKSNDGGESEVTKIRRIYGKYKLLRLTR